MQRASTVAVQRSRPRPPARARGRVRLRVLAVVATLTTLGLGACTRSSEGGGDEGRAVTGLETPPAPSCPTAPIPEARAPEVRAEHEQLDHWLAKLEHEGPDLLDAPLLDAEDHSALAARVAELPGGWRDPLDPAVAEAELVERELQERLDWLRERLASGKYVEAKAGALERAASRIAAAEVLPQPALRFVVEETPLWCVPSREGLYSPPIDRDFDRNRCASLHPGELVRALKATPDGAWIYVEAGHSVGWLAQSQPSLGPPTQDPEVARRRRDQGPRLTLVEDFEGLRAGSSFPLLSSPEAEGPYSIEVPGLEGPSPRELPRTAPVTLERPPLTRRALLTHAFAQMGQPYGWGGRAGHRDCSRYLHDLLAIFAIRMPRNSGVQAKLGTRSVDLAKLDEDQKRAAIRSAARGGVVLLYMPGHIMLYLGHEPGIDGAPGRDYGISALSEYLTPCPGGPDTVHRLDRVAVTTLELGRGTERRAFIERITRMAVFGGEAEHP